MAARRGTTCAALVRDARDARENPGALLFGSIGALDAQGQGAIAFNLPAGTDASLAGLQLNHAGVVLDFSAGFIQLLEVTNAVSVDLVP